MATRMGTRVDLAATQLAIIRRWGSMERVDKVFYSIPVHSLVLAALSADAQDDQSGFISIDCGLADSDNYTDLGTGIFYTSDASFIDGGESKSIASAYKTNSIERQYLTVRSFPQGERNCYTLWPVQGKNSKYLIRASFMYGNYDETNQPPKFDLHLGVEYWDTVAPVDASSVVRKEIIHTALSDYINVCLVKTGPSVPFISSLELRILENTKYSTQYGSLKLIGRVNFCPLSDQSVRYKDDVIDRVWEPLTLPNTTRLSTRSRTVDVSQGSFQLPSSVMGTACTPNGGDVINFFWGPVNATDKNSIYMHFADPVERQDNQTRNMSITINEVHWFGPFAPFVLVANTIYSPGPQYHTGFTNYNATIKKTEGSTLPPIINAAEIYVLREFSHPETYEGDVAAISSIKATYGLIKNWQGDPCAPQDFIWEGLDCTSDGSNPLRIISVTLSSNGLQGTIAPAVANLTKLQTLDLSNNNLTGNVPGFLAQLDSLKVLNLKGNKFTGPFPSQLLEKSKEGKLSLSFDDPNNNKNPKKKSIVIPIVSSVAAALVILALLLTLWIIHWRKPKGSKRVDIDSRKNDGFLGSDNKTFSGEANESDETRSLNYNNLLLGTKRRQFSYAEVLRITNHFERVIGEGGFGIVYHGYVGNSQVAVKMLSETSRQGYKEFQTEVNLLLAINHKNLTSLVGYCCDGTNMGIMYEYMANGNLEKHLLGSTNPNALNWIQRLRIAMDAAQGLEYLHHGCRPSVLHRDIKTANILLDERFEAKLADFGLSRTFVSEGGAHVTTRVAGTQGYIAPEYYSTNIYTEKSDVYSFGVVLLEMISGRRAISRDVDRVHIVPWVNTELEKGDVTDIVDSRLQRNYAIDSVEKFVKLARACASRDPAKRPTINNAVLELKECLAIEVNSS